MMGDDGVDVAA